MHSPPDEPGKSADPEVIKDQKIDDKARNRRRDTDLKAVLETAEGRRFVHDLLADCGEHRTSFHTNALVMAHAEGARNLGLSIKARIARVCPEHLGEVLKSG